MSILSGVFYRHLSRPRFIAAGPRCLIIQGSEHLQRHQEGWLAAVSSSLFMVRPLEAVGPIQQVCSSADRSKLCSFPVVGPWRTNRAPVSLLKPCHLPCLDCWCLVLELLVQCLSPDECLRPQPQLGLPAQCNRVPWPNLGFLQGVEERLARLPGAAARLQARFPRWGLELRQQQGRDLVLKAPQPWESPVHGCSFWRGVTNNGPLLRAQIARDSRTLTELLCTTTLLRA